MPKVAGPLAELDAESRRIAAASARASFGVPEGGTLTLSIESAPTDAGVVWFAFLAVLEAKGHPPHVLWRTRAKSIGAGLRTFARKFPKVDLPPSPFLVHGRGAGVSIPALQKLVLGGIAEALGRELPPEVAPAAPEGDWPAILRSGRDGLRRWNKLKAAERQAVSLDGVELSGADLPGLKLAKGTAKKAKFDGASLAGATLSDTALDAANFDGADLSGSTLEKAQAQSASFRGANLAGAKLARAWLFGASLAGADLSGADLSEASLPHADLDGANLDGAKLEGATFDARTAWPAGFAIPPDCLFTGKGTDPRLSGKGKKAVAADLSGLMARLQGLIDPKRLKRTLDMLRTGRNQLFAEIDPAYVRGIVRSQTAEDLVYSCVLMQDGSYSCCTPDLAACMGLRGEPCKHLLTLILGLARAGQLDPATVDPWLVAAKGKNHRWNKTTTNHLSDTLLRYKGVQAGEVDWRPTETIPEDFYSL